MNCVATQRLRKLSSMRDPDTIDSELRLLAAVRRSIREHGGTPSSQGPAHVSAGARGNRTTGRHVQDGVDDEDAQALRAEGFTPTIPMFAPQSHGRVNRGPARRAWEVLGGRPAPTDQLARECQGSAEVTGKHQPKPKCQASVEVIHREVCPPQCVPPAGLEPATTRLEVMCSVQLSYGGRKHLSAGQCIQRRSKRPAGAQRRQKCPWQEH